MSYFPLLGCQRFSGSSEVIIDLSKLGSCSGNYSPLNRFVLMSVVASVQMGPVRVPPLTSILVT